MKDLKALIIALLIGITAVSVYKYAAVIKEKNNLIAVSDRQKAEISALESEKKKLAQNIEAEKKLKEQIIQENYSSKERIADLENQIAQAEEVVSELNSRLAVIKSENAALQVEKTILRNQILQLQKANQKLSIRPIPAPELKTEIKAVKTKTIRAKKTAVKDEITQDKDSQGNKGFMVINGETTPPAQAIKIEVKPASSSESVIGK